MLVCRLMGHRMRFSTEGAEMRWTCERGCGAGGRKTYGSAAQAARYARELDREDREDIGKRPMLSTLPLWLARRAARKR